MAMRNNRGKGGNNRHHEKPNNIPDEDIMEEITYEDDSDDEQVPSPKPKQNNQQQRTYNSQGENRNRNNHNGGGNGGGNNGGGNFPSPTDPTAFNTISLMGHTTGYRMELKSITKQIKDLCGRTLSNIHTASYYVDKPTGAIHWYVWLPAKCEHFADVSVLHDKSMMVDAIPRHSQELISFVKKFAPRTPNGKVPKVENMLVQDGNSNGKNKFVGIEIDIAIVMRIAFDIDGIVYQRKFGERPPRCDLTIKYIYDEPRESHTGYGDRKERGHLIGVEFSKSLASAVSRNHTPVPRRSGNFG